MTANEWRKLTIEEMKELIGKENPIIIEIGACKGKDTQEFLNAYDSPTIYCFEPDPRAIEIFKDNIESDNIELIEKAISDKVGECELFLSSKIRASSIKEPEKHLKKYRSITFDESRIVKTTTLDTLIATENIGLIDFIWADTQGAEEEMIKGGRKTLGKTRYLLTEYSNEEMYKDQITLEEIDNLLEGFEKEKVWRHDVLFSNKKF